MTLKRVFALAAVVAAAAFAASAQTRELNPTVKVLARPQSPVPVECATDQTVVPALEAEAPALEPATAPAPPSSDLRTTLRRLQVAADANDYAAFKSALAEAKRAAAAHPAGGERNAANDALQVFADIARVWDYAMTSPTGGFFDATVQGGSLLNAMKRYPDFGRALADQTINSGGRTLYPTPETRRFLARESARRLTRLGVSTPAQVARGTQPEPAPRRTVTAPPPVKKPVQVAAKPPASKTTTPKKTAAKTPTPKTTTPKTAKATPPATTKPTAIKATPVPKPKPPVKVADTSTMPPGPPIVATPQPKAPATTTTASSSAQTTTTAPITTTTAPVTTTTTATATTDTTVSTTSSAPTDTSVTAAPDTSATTTAVPSSKQNGNMNLILAVVLILVGIGVLVVLFRASD